VEAALQPAPVPGEFLQRVTRWAEGQPDPVSVILFGSRARGDCGPESDWDIAVVFDGERPPLEDLPHRIGDAPVQWVALDRSWALQQLNVCGIPHAAAADGLCLHGTPLPAPESKDMNMPNAWEFLYQGYKAMDLASIVLVRYWNTAPAGRCGHDSGLAFHSALAAELACKAVLSMRGVEPRRSHSVAELCADLARAHPADPFLPALRELNGRTATAHVSIYPNRKGPPEEIGVSTRRLIRGLHVYGAVLPAACDMSFAEEGTDSLKQLDLRLDTIFAEVGRLESSDCPRDIRLQVQAGLDTWPPASELWDRLTPPPAGRTPERAVREPPRGR